MSTAAQRSIPRNCGKNDRREFPFRILEGYIDACETYRGAGQNAVVSLSLRRGGIAKGLRRRLPPSPDER
jgi:hypothetical protein